jgi:hypothetical protein
MTEVDDYPICVCPSGQSPYPVRLSVDNNQVSANQQCRDGKSNYMEGLM